MTQMPSSAELRADGPIAPLGDVSNLLALHEPAPPAFHVAKIRVRVAHGVPLVHAGVSAVLSRSGEFQVVTLDGLHGSTDVLVTDVDFGLRTLGSGTVRNVVIVAQDDRETVIRKALGKGVRGFLLHTCGGEELTSAVKTVSRGGTAFAPAVTNRIVQSIASEPLTERELEVLHLMVHGLSDKDMARKLLISLGTVKSHMKSILTKLGAARRTEAAAIAQRRGLARLDSEM